MFKVGDRVIREKVRHWEPRRMGTIIDIQKHLPYPYLVEYDDYIGGHDGHNLSEVVGKDGFCWWESEDTIKEWEE